MKKVSLEDAKDYDAPGHFGVYTGLLQGELFGNKASDLDDLWIGISHFLPGGGCDMSSSENENVYYVLSGEVTIKTPDGEKIVLEENDSIYIEDEERAIENETKEPATMLVIYSTR